MCVELQITVLNHLRPTEILHSDMAVKSKTEMSCKSALGDIFKKKTEITAAV